MAKRAHTSFSVAFAMLMPALVAFSGACGGADDPRVQLVVTPEGGAPSPDDAWGTTACGSCVRTACDDARGQCTAEPTCARRLECLEACPAGAGAAASSPDSECAARCPDAFGQAAEAARDAFTACRVAGPGAQCAACAGDGGARYRHPLLNQQCSGPDARSACLPCATRYCCKTSAACTADPTCVRLAACYGACTDNACTVDCVRAYEPAAATYLAHVDCTLTRCPAECIPPSSQSCAQCLFGDCADEKITCDSDQECALLTVCIRSCGVTSPMGCSDACVRAHPTAVASFVALTTCISTRCLGCSLQ